jgi:transcriptional regulator
MGQRYFLMYVNDHFKTAEIEAFHDLIDEYPFGLFIGGAPSPHAAHLPLILHRAEGDCGTIYGHLPRRDPLANSVISGDTALIVFTGPYSYISPRYYANEGLPTYNFLAVHVEGKLNHISARDDVLEHLNELAVLHESKLSGEPWKMDSADPAYVGPLLQHITTFAMRIETIAGKIKLNQNRSARDRQGVIRALSQSVSSHNRAIAAAMTKYSYTNHELVPLIQSDTDMQRRIEQSST